MDIVTLLTSFARALFELSEDFYANPDQFFRIEKLVADLSKQTAADFLSLILTEMDDLIRDSQIRKERFNIQRKRSRTLITTVGDVHYMRTLFQDLEDGTVRCLLDELIKLPEHERFSSQAEAKVLYEAEVHSYQHAADSLQIGNQKISKVAVMNKVHAVTQELPEPVPTTLKKCRYLYIEADEDHIHGQQNGQPSCGMIGKLIYLYEGKEDVCAGKRMLLSPHYLGGLYTGSVQNQALWEEVQKYIESHYDTRYIKQIYISGDGASWIKAGIDYVDKAVLVQDRFHLMKYINRVSNLMLDDANAVKGKFYKYIYKDKPKKVRKLLGKIRKCTGRDSLISETESYILGNWEAIQRAFHDKNVLGCSAEGHVSNIYSERMSSRPMGWSETGSDRMCRLRCYVNNYGADKIIDLVEYRRRKLMEELPATGTDGLVEIEAAKRMLTSEQRRTMSYIERLQATIPGRTVRKTIAIRTHLNDL